MARKRDVPSETLLTPDTVRTPLIFISHDSRDADLAEAFENLLADASGGVLRAFRSSDRRGGSGIEFGAEWYSTIMTKLSQATDVVALLTQRSLDRPWILYEVGVARGKLDKPTFGVAFGIPLSDVSGPFAQFQNSNDDEDSLTKLVLQLIRRNPEAAPREEAVRRQVNAFREYVGKIGSSQSDRQRQKLTAAPESATVAKLFEEVKIMFRQLPDLIADTISARLPVGSSLDDPEGVVTRGHELIRRIELGGSQSTDDWFELAKLINRVAADLSEPFIVAWRGAVSSNDADLQLAEDTLQKIIRSRSTTDAAIKRGVLQLAEHALDVLRQRTHEAKSLDKPPA